MIALEDFPGLTIVDEPLYYGAVNPRNKDWNKLRIQFVRKNPFCSWCKGIEFLQVHHIRPFYLWPELELKQENLIVLCEKPGLNCHFENGHLGDWKSYNPLLLKQIYFKYNKPYLKDESIWG